jgi:hypothetical protein
MFLINSHIIIVKERTLTPTELELFGLSSD